MRPLATVPLLAVTLTLAAAPGCRRAPAIQREHGNIPLARLDGAPVTLGAHGRNVTVIALWNTACAPCVKELPYLDQLAESYSGDPDVAILAVNVGDDLPQARETAAKLALKLPVLSDVKGEIGKLLSPGGLAIPLLVTIDPKFHQHRKTGFAESAASGFVAENRAVIEKARAGTMADETIAAESASSGSGGPKVTLTQGSVTPEQFASIKAKMRASFKEQHHVSDEEADRMVASLEAQVQGDGGVPRVVVPAASSSR